jgi:hypothetical protein
MAPSDSHRPNSTVSRRRVHGRFTAGFDTADPKEAKAPLDALT